MLTSPVPIFYQMRAISSSIMIVAGSVSGGGMKVPSSISAASSVSAEYPSNSNKAPWQMGALSAQLKRSDKLFAKPFSTGVLVLQTSSSLFALGMTTCVTPPALFFLVTYCIPRQVFCCRSFRINVSSHFTSSSFSAFIASFSFAFRYPVRIHAESARIRRVLSFSSLYISIRTLVESAMGFLMPFFSQISSC